jgi:ABC-type phosphate transport system permease subunit
MATPTMQTSTLVAGGGRERAVSLRWIIGAGDDLVWFIGSVASSYLLFPMLLGWAVLIDAPHVFGTFSRTYLDREERRARKRLLWGSLGFFAVGPLMVLAGLGAFFFFLAALWAYYHLVKQHYGFMVLYKKKNRDLDKTDNALDRAFILAAMAYPFVAFVARDADALRRVPAQLAGALGARFPAVR